MILDFMQLLSEQAERIVPGYPRLSPSYIC